MYERCRFCRAHGRIKAGRISTRKQGWLSGAESWASYSNPCRQRGTMDNRAGGGRSGMKNIVEQHLPRGRENAIPAKQLAALMGFASVRMLQKEIERERASGAIILSKNEDGGGYFKPAYPREIERFIHTLSSRARHTFAALESARDELSRLTGQCEFEEWRKNG